MRKTPLAVSVVAVSVALAPACASTGYVRETAGVAAAQIDAVRGTVEQIQRRVGQNEARLAELGPRTDDAAMTAADARGAASAAAAAADAVNMRVDALDASVRRLVYAVTLSGDEGNFPSGGSELPDSARARLDQLVAQLMAMPQNVYFEIEGHTDSTGAAVLNQRLGLERANAVKRYLYEQHQVPLFKMNVLSYGEERPEWPNDTPEGRAQNRRVVVRVLS